MADKKITQLTNITGADLASADEFVVVDITADETKAITFDELKTAFDTGTGFVRVTGDTMTGDLSFGDNDKAIFGAGSDLQIYHDGSQSYIDDAGTGRLNIRANDRLYLRDTDNSVYAVFYSGAGSFINHNGNTKLATTSTGIDVTGTVTADGLTVDGDATIQNTGNSYRTFTIGANRSASVNTLGRLDYDWDGTPVARIHAISGTDATNKDNGDLVLSTSADGTLKQRLFIDQGGDISFYEDTGTTAKFFWDASAESLGIGTSSPDSLAGLEVYGKRLYVDAGDNFALRLEKNSVVGGYIGAPALSSLAFYSSGGAERMRIDASGNVGIGTSSPTALLHLSSSAPSILMQDSDGTGRSSINCDNGSLNLKFNSNNAVGTSVLTFNDFNTERMRIDSSGNVGIGTSSPSEDLHVSGTGDKTIGVESTNTGTGANAGVKILSADGGDFLWQTGNVTGNALRLYDLNASAERMRIDSSGNVLVGTTDNNVTNNSGNNAGINIGVAGIKGFMSSARYQGPPLSINRLGNDGDIQLFSKDGSTVGSIGTIGSDLTIGTGDVALRFQDGSDNLIPHNVATNSTRDSGINIGTSGARFKDLYLSGGVYLGGTGSANKLEDYEEGTWNPTFTEQSAGTGTYTKIGRTVQVWGEVICDANGAGVNALALSGLPFSVLGDTYRIHLGFDSMNTSANGNNIPTPFNGMMLMQHDQYVRPSSTGGNPYFKSDLFVIGTRVYISGQFETTA